MQRIRQPLLANEAIDEQALTTFLCTLDDPLFRFLAWIRFTAWGQRP